MTTPFSSLRVCVALLAALVSAGTGAAADRPQRPNIVLVVADDLGWSDLGSFGSEISTPNLDTMADAGLTMTQFRVAPTCSPTRAMLLTGVDNHLAGLGTMEYVQAPNQRDSLYYAAELQPGVLTLAELLQDAGYATLMSGKWHLSRSPANFPSARGFQRSFALLQGGASHFADARALHAGYRAQYLEDGKPTRLPGDFYSSRSYTDKLLQYLDTLDGERPFFAYLAFTAPHDPLQVPEEWLDRYRGRYDAGPQAIRRDRLQGQRAAGLIADDTPAWMPPVYPEWLPMGRAPWVERSAEQRQRDARPMEIYAAMVELMDQQIGRLRHWLEERGELDNTYILFMSDNGANAATPLLYPHTSRDWLLSQRDQSLEGMGKAGSHTFLGQEWAVVANTPLALFKATVADGGLRVPLIVNGPGVPAGRRSSAGAHATDIVPTLLQLAGVDMATAAGYRDHLRPSGRSLLDVWAGLAPGEPRVQGTELFGNRSLVLGPWKARYLNVPMGPGRWELFNLERDPGETTDLAAQYPGRLAELVAAYDHYADASGVIAPDPPPRPSAEVLYAGPCNRWCSLRFAVLDALITVRVFIKEVLQ